MVIVESVIDDFVNDNIKLGIQNRVYCIPRRPTVYVLPGQSSRCCPASSALFSIISKLTEHL
jgi:hypothetical protein